MCGIAGIVGVSNTTSAADGVQRMLKVLARRGPDSQGIARFAGAVLGHRRLAILDLTDAGHQPMAARDGDVAVVFNGAIYNFLELRALLSSHGSVFRSNTDTEVLLHGYLTWGLDQLVARLRGMFAFALWDNRSRSLYLVRDRLGVKPLVYLYTNGTLAFASTVRALHAAGYSRGLHNQAVKSFLLSGFIPEDNAIYCGIRKLPAGSILEWRDGVHAIRQYWAPRFNSFSPIPFRQAVEETKQLLLDAVKTRLVADVEVGALLSSGIDSALICWALKRLNQDIQVYTVAAPGDPWDEAHAASETARLLGLKHRLVDISDAGPLEVADLVSAFAEPFGAASALGMLRVCRAITQSSSVKVLLTGDGGDDVFLGYPRHRNLWIASRFARLLPESAKRWARLVVSAMPRQGPLRRAAALLQYAVDGLPGVLRHTSSEMQLAEIAGERLADLDDRDGFQPQSRTGEDVLVDFLEYEFSSRFLGEYLTKVDAATMYHALEARSPFLDHHLWDFASSLPFSVRLRHGRLKAILRQIVAEELGQPFAQRPKRGFGIPVHRWITTRWRPWVEGLLSDPILETDGWLRPGASRHRLMEAVAAGTASSQLWYMIVLEAWLRHERTISYYSGTHS